MHFLLVAAAPRAVPGFQEGWGGMVLASGPAIPGYPTVWLYELVRKPLDKEVLYCERPLRRVDAIMFWHYMNNVPDRTRPDRKPDQTGSRTGPEAGPDRKLDCCNSTVATVLLQQYCCNTTVATLLLQPYCCNSIDTSFFGGGGGF